MKPPPVPERKQQTSFVELGGGNSSEKAFGISPTNKQKLRNTVQHLDKFEL